MAKEIERKFLVDKKRWHAFKATHQPSAKPYQQGYIATAVVGQSVRVRIAGEQGFLTIKGPAQGKKGLTRTEFEYAISVSDAQEMLETLCERPFISKTRYEVCYEGTRWEVDEFHAENAGLIVAEVELASEEQTFASPNWTSAEVSGERRYYNASLVKHPYAEWNSKD